MKLSCGPGLVGVQTEGSDCIPPEQGHTGRMSQVPPARGLTTLGD